MKKINRVLILLLSLIAFSPLSSAEDNDVKQEAVFDVNKGGTLEVSVNIGNVRIKTWDKNKVRVQVSGEDDVKNVDYPYLHIGQEENVIYIKTDKHYGYEPWGEVDINVEMPSHFNVQLETSAGDISINGKVTGTIDAQTSGGNISIGSVDGKADLETSGGDIVTEDIKGDLVLSTSGGNIRVGVVTGITDVHTSGGDIEIERADKKLTAETAGGNVHVGDIGGDAIVSTSGGDIVLERVSGGAKLKTAGGNISLRSANGVVVAKTAGGDIHADSIVGSLDAKTSAGNIEVALIPTGTGKSKLTTSVGDVQLYLPENAKASIAARNRVRYWGQWDSDEEDAIVSDYKEDTYDKDGRNKEVRATYTLNGGGQQISIETSMGHIEILKPGSHRHESREGKHKKKYKR